MSPQEIESVIAHSSHQTSVERLEIYANAYYARLLECMRHEYPIMAQAMGEELFDEFSVQYLHAYPSRSYTLNDLGADFAAFLAATHPLPRMKTIPGSISWSTWQDWNGALPRYSMVRGRNGGPR